MRFVKLLSVVPECPPNHVSEKSKLSGKISQLMKEDVSEWNRMLQLTVSEWDRMLQLTVSEWDRMLRLTSDKDFSTDKAKERLLQQLLKEKLRVWLLQKKVEGGKGPIVLDQCSRGVLHFAAALGCEWAILPSCRSCRSCRNECQFPGCEWLCGRTIYHYSARPANYYSPNNK